MSQKEMHVGIIGADTKASWAKLSHVPAINALPDLRLAAVATRNEQSARAAAEAFAADRWFSDPFAMMLDDRIDIVTIAVKVPAHRELVLAALNAGKAVYCEAPLGRTIVETEEMASAAGSLHTAIGLQGRMNPAVQQAAQLVSSGKIGRPLNARVVFPCTGYGPELPSAYDFFNKASSGANLLPVVGGHTLDVVEAVLGPIVEVDARTEILWPTVKLSDIGEESVRDAPDHVGILGKTLCGVVFTADISSWCSATGCPLRLRNQGIEGMAQPDQRSPLRLSGRQRQADVEYRIRDTPGGRGFRWVHGSGDQLWERFMPASPATCVQAPTTRPASTTHITMDVWSRLSGAPPSVVSGRK
jgi:predicted dehydrogenase